MMTPTYIRSLPASRLSWLFVALLILMGCSGCSRPTLVEIDYSAQERIAWERLNRQRSLLCSKRKIEYGRCLTATGDQDACQRDFYRLAKNYCEPGEITALVVEMRSRPLASSSPGPADESDTAPDWKWTVGDRWRGYYVCAQGETDLQLQLVDINPSNQALGFRLDFQTAEVKGSYRLSGKPDDADGNLKLTPEGWIEPVDGYIMVGMEGKLSADGSTYAGRITHESCGEFHLRR